jgi:hypothetical protein
MFFSWVNSHKDHSENQKIIHNRNIHMTETNTVLTLSYVCTTFFPLFFSKSNYDLCFTPGMSADEVAEPCTPTSATLPIRHNRHMPTAPHVPLQKK